MRFVLLLIPLLFFNSCQGQNDNDLPEELEIAFKFIEKNWKKKHIESFKSTEESVATIEQHRGMGLTIRNKLLRNGKDSDQMIKFFTDLGIFHLDDMSSIILTSYHRHLNGKEIKLQEQVDYYISYWKPIIECDKNMDTLAMETFNNYKVGDTIIIEMPVNENNSAVDYQCNLDWEFNDSTDLLITAIITEKHNSELPVQLRFTINVLSKNHAEIEVFMKEVYPGDLLSVKLKTCWHIR